MLRRDNMSERMEAYCILAKAYRLRGEVANFFKYTTKAVTSEGDGCAEICYELGMHYLSQTDYDEALIWFHAAINTPCLLNLQTHRFAEEQIEKCYDKI